MMNYKCLMYKEDKKKIEKILIVNFLVYIIEKQNNKLFTTSGFKLKMSVCNMIILEQKNLTQGNIGILKDS